MKQKITEVIPGITVLNDGEDVKKLDLCWDMMATIPALLVTAMGGLS